MSMTEAEIEALLVEYRAARTAILKLGQSYTIQTGGSMRVVTHANLKEVQDQISNLEQQLKDIQGDGGTVFRPGW